MVKYLLGVLTGIVLVVMLGVLVLVMVAALGSAEPGIAADSVLNLEFSGSIPEHNWSDLSLDFFRKGPPLTMLELRELFRKAAVDARIRAIVLRCNGLDAGWARAQEIRWNIAEFRKSKKPVLAYLEGGSSLDYFVASAADQVYLAPEALLDVKGFRAEVAFYKDTLGKLGIEAEMENVGKYKSAVEPYSRNNMSEAFREVTNSILDELYGQFLEETGESRGKTAEQMSAIVDQGPFMAHQALDAGLVDGLLYEDEFTDQVLKKIAVKEMHEVDQRQYRRISAQSLGLRGDHEVAVVYAVGAIMQGESESDPFFGERVLGSDSLAETLRQVRKDESIEAVILRVDSPGGDAFASDQIWREMQLLKEAKPLVISMSDVAASGGYYLAMAGAPIVAYPGTYTGSIGVFFGKINLRGLYEKLGIQKEILTRGRFADIDTDYRAMTSDERAKLRESIEATYHTFVRKVAESRGSSWEEIHEVAQGRVWLGSQAKENGLIDEVGGLDKAIEMAKNEAGIEQDATVRLTTYPAAKRFVEMLVESEFGESTELQMLIRTHFSELASWPVLLKGGMMRMAPYTISVQ
jgi:protease-4